MHTYTKTRTQTHTDTCKYSHKHTHTNTHRQTQVNTHTTQYTNTHTGEQSAPAARGTGTHTKHKTKHTHTGEQFAPAARGTNTAAGSRHSVCLGRVKRGACDADEGGWCVKFKKGCCDSQLSSTAGSRQRGRVQRDRRRNCGTGTGSAYE